MTMQPLLIAPDGAINKAMIRTGPVLTSFFTPQSVKPQGPSYLTPPLRSSSSSSSQSVVPRPLPDVFIPAALMFQMPKRDTIATTAAQSRVNGLQPGSNMLHSGIPGHKIGFTLLLPFAPFVFLCRSHFFFTAESSRSPFYLSACKIAVPVQMAEEYKVRLVLNVILEQ